METRHGKRVREYLQDTTSPNQPNRSSGNFLTLHIIVDHSN